MVFAVAPIEQWEPGEVALWLESCLHAELGAKIKEHQIDGAALVHLGSEGWKELGVSSAVAQAKILAAIWKVQSASPNDVPTWQQKNVRDRPSTLDDLGRGNDLGFPPYVRDVSNGIRSPSPSGISINTRRSASSHENLGHTTKHSATNSQWIGPSEKVASVIGAWQTKRSIENGPRDSGTMSGELIQALTYDAVKQVRNHGLSFLPCCRPVIKYSSHHLVQPQISNYDAAALLPITSVVGMFTWGSALRTSAFFINLIMVIVLSFLFVVLILMVQLFNVEQNIISSSAYNDLRLVTSSITNWAAFLLGPLLGVMLSRWWALRCNCLGSLWGCCDDLMLLIGSQCDRDEDAFIRKQMHNWITASWLLCQFSFTDINDEDALDVLYSSDTISAGERELLADQASKPQIVLCWMMRMIRVLADKGIVDSFDKQVLQEMVIKARDSIGYLYAHFDTPVLFAFVHLMTLVVHATSILQSACCAITIADRISNNIMETDTDLAAVCSAILFLLIQLIVFQGLLNLLLILKQPFSPLKWGLPLMDFHKTFSKESVAFVEANYLLRNQIDSSSDPAEFWHRLTRLEGRDGCKRESFRRFRNSAPPEESVVHDSVGKSPLFFV